MFEMRKNHVAVALTAALACGATAAHNPVIEEPVAVVYFSRAGNAIESDTVDGLTSASRIAGTEKVGTTELVAREIASRTHADVFSLQALESYPASFDAVVDRNQKEIGRDVAVKSLPDLAKYRTIFVGYPTWNMNLPGVVGTFLKDTDAKPANVFPFATHDGYGAGRGFDRIRNAFEGAQVGTGLALSSDFVTSNAKDVGKSVDQWLKQFAKSSDPVTVQIKVGGEVIEAQLNDTPEARQFEKLLPLSVHMGEYGGREFYGSLDGEITTTSEGQLTFEDGTLTYCPTNNTVAIFYAQSSRPNLTMKVYPIGKVTSDLRVFTELDSYTQFRFAVK